MNDVQPVLEVSGLTKSFGGVHAVQDVSFRVAPGSVHGLIGPNGAGKTTCFNMIAGAFRPDSGSVVFRGEPITGQPAWRISRTGISRTFQNIRVFHELTVRENIYSAALNRSDAGYLGSLFGSPAARRADRAVHEYVDELVERLHLQRYADMQALDVPIGIQRRLEIARAIALRPSLLLLDEPTAGMNGSETANIGEIVRELAGEIAVLLVEHDMSFVVSTCDSLTVLDRGRMIAEGTPEQVTSDKAVIEAYLGEPL